MTTLISAYRQIQQYLISVHFFQNYDVFIEYALWRLVGLGYTSPNLLIYFMT